MKLLNLLSKNKSFILFLLLIQLLFFIIFFWSQVILQPMIMEKSYEIAAYMNDIDSSQDMGDDPLMLYRQGKEIVNLLILDIAVLFLLFLIGSNMLWTLSVKMINNLKWKALPKSFLRFILISLTYLIPYTIIAVLALQEIILPSSQNTIAVQVTSVFLLITTAALAYFMPISLSLIHLPYIEIFKRTFRIASTKPHILLIYYIPTILVIAAAFALMVFSADINLIVMLLAIALFLLVYTLARILIVFKVMQLDHQ